MVLSTCSTGKVRKKAADQEPGVSVFDQTVDQSKLHERSDWSAKLLCRSGQFLIALGLFHFPAFLLSGSEWEGAISWRKPILFGVSTGMTLWSLGWIAGRLGHSKLKQIVATIVSITLVAEVLLITAQQWRGQASHFNQSSTVDATIDLAMFWLIVIAFAGICWFGVRCCGRTRLPADYRLAAISGMAFLIFSCVIGFVISAHGYTQMEQGLPPETVGQNGVAKFPHGFAIHALQLFPMIVFLLRKIGCDMKTRLLLMWSIVVGTAFLLAFSIAQTMLGLSRFDLQSPISVVFLGLGVASLLFPWPLVHAKRFFAAKS